MIVTNEYAQATEDIDKFQALDVAAEEDKSDDDIITRNHNGDKIDRISFEGGGYFITQGRLV